MTDKSGKTATSAFQRRSEENPEDLENPWPSIVDAMYDGIRVRRSSQDNEWYYERNTRMENKTGLDRVEVERGLAYMERVGLMEEIGDDEIMSLTELGIQVANDRKQTTQQENTNRAIATFTLVLVFLEIVGNLPNTGYRLLGSLIILVGLLVVTANTDVLSVPFP